MPKIIELTVEIDIQRVSCPGVWLCQDGRVSLSVFALGTSYQTCLLPPMFPLMFKDSFYFRKRFQETCALNNICCLLKDETIYCELVQWCDDCTAADCIMLAQYLGALNDVLFPPYMCSNDGVDLLMRRSKVFPGILSPKIEIATKVRIDEVWNQCGMQIKAAPCLCGSDDSSRQRPVCHTPEYHRHKCVKSNRRSPSRNARTRSRSSGSRSCCSLTNEDYNISSNCKCAGHNIPSAPSCPQRVHRPRNATHCRPQYNTYNVVTGDPWVHGKITDQCDNFDDEKRSNNLDIHPSREDIQKTILESRYIDNEITKSKEKVKKILFKPKITPCVCEICKKYHELFHSVKH